MRARALCSRALGSHATLRHHADTLLYDCSRKAVAIGRNYREHASEMKSPLPTEPFWFFKPSTSYLRTSSGLPVLLPPGAGVHHEVELAAVIGRTASRVSARNAMEHVAGYVCAVDMTARAWQASAKQGGLPWSLAKGCDTFLPLSAFVHRDDIPTDAGNGDGRRPGEPDAHLWLCVNGELRQSGSTRDMVFGLPSIIEHVSKHVTLEEWDLVLTGTPAGVGPVEPGDVVTAGIMDVVDMRFRCEASA